MKYIIVGLGNFGGSLAEKLTAQGNEVIGIDDDMSRVENLKERITHTICMDSTDEVTVDGLPLLETDVVIIAIGEDQGANVMTTALFKSKEVKRLISRAINPLHERVLDAIGVDDIVRPEQDSAERWAKKLNTKHVVDSFELDDLNSIVEVRVPPKYVGSTIGSVKWEEKYHLRLVTVINSKEVESSVGNTYIQQECRGIINPDEVMTNDDILVLFGSNADLQNFLQ